MYVRRQHDLELDEARVRVQAVAESLQRQYSLSSEWQGNRLHFTGSGVNGHIEVDHRSIEIRVSLGLPLKILETVIRTEIERALDGHLA
jgi:putative polyhydroxyalkanoate system protein